MINGITFICKYAILIPIFSCNQSQFNPLHPLYSLYNIQGHNYIIVLNFFGSHFFFLSLLKAGAKPGSGFKANFKFETEYLIPIGTPAPDGSCKFTYRSSSRKDGR